MTRNKPTRRTRRFTGPAGRSAPDPAAILSSPRADTDIAVATAGTTSIPTASSPRNPTRSEAAAPREPIAANRTTMTKTTKARSSSPRGRTGSPTPARKTKVARSGKEKPSETLVLDEITETLPKTRVECPKCGHYEAFWVMRQTRAADEPTTRIYRCVKCQHTWREY